MSPAPRLPHQVPDHIPAHLHDAFAWAKGGPLSPHCPYKPGAAVKLHGRSGEQPGHRRTGFRGWVVATILTGITETGQEWWEEWGRLEPAGYTGEGVGHLHLLPRGTISASPRRSRPPTCGGLAAGHLRRGPYVTAPLPAGAARSALALHETASRPADLCRRAGMLPAAPTPRRGPTMRGTRR